MIPAQHSTAQHSTAHLSQQHTACGDLHGFEPLLVLILVRLGFRSLAGSVGCCCLAVDSELCEFQILSAELSLQALQLVLQVSAPLLSL